MKTYKVTVDECNTIRRYNKQGKLTKVVLQWGDDWFSVKRYAKDKKSLPSVHKRGADNKGRMHTLCGIRVREATHKGQLCLVPINKDRKEPKVRICARCFGAR